MNRQQQNSLDEWLTTPPEPREHDEEADWWDDFEVDAYRDRDDDLDYQVWWEEGE